VLHALAWLPAPSSRRWRSKAPKDAAQEGGFREPGCAGPVRCVSKDTSLVVFKRYHLAMATTRTHRGPPPLDRVQPWHKFEATADAIIHEALHAESGTGPVGAAYSSHADARWGSLAHDLAALFPDGHQADLLAAEVDVRAGEMPEAQRELVDQLLDRLGSAQPVRPTAHKWFQLVCQGCSGRKDGRGELGFAVRCTCVLKRWSPASLAVWLWRDQDAKGRLLRQPASPDKALDRRLTLQCRACGATPVVNLRVLVDKVDQLRRETLKAYKPGCPTVLSINPGGRFGSGAAPRVPALGSRAARTRRPTLQIG